MEQYIRSHEMLLKEFGLEGKEEAEQTVSTRNILEISLRRSKQRRSLEQI